MPEMGDMERLREYEQHGSEAAFAEVVQRQVNLVYSVALRHTGIAAQAEEITQAVFVILARKAPTLGPDTILEGWLHETTRLTALSFLRGERRRQFREQEVYMQSTLPDSPDAQTWQQLAPLLDEALARLGKKDRDAVILRFLKEKNLTEVAAALRVNESAAQRRVHRAVEKLRKFFTNRGIALPAVALTAAISANSVQAAPVTLATSVTVLACGKGAAASSSTLTLIKGALKIMAWTKAKMAIAIAVGILVATTTTTVIVRKAVIQTSSILRQRLDNGSELILNRVTFGDKHRFVHKGFTVNMDWPGHEQLIAEFSLVSKNPANHPLVKPAFFRQFRCVLHGDQGIEYVEEFMPNDFEQEAGGYYSYVETGVIPRDAKWLWFRIEERDASQKDSWRHYDSWKTIANFKTINPAPPVNRKWTASALPTTNFVEGMDIVLGQITVKTVPSWTNDIWNLIVSVPTQIRNSGGLLTNWSATWTQAQDASGNSEDFPEFPSNRGLDPRFVWKLDMDFQPVSGFSEDTMATVQLPKAGATLTTNFMDVPVTISCDGNWIDASMPTNYPKQALKFIRARDSQGNELADIAGSWSQYVFRKGDFMARNGNSMTMGAKPAQVTFTIVPIVHTTFYAQPRLLTDATEAEK